MKKKVDLLSFLTLISMPLVSAGPVEGLEKLLGGLREAIVIFIEFTSNILIDMENFDQYLLAKLLLLVLIYILVLSVLRKSKFFGDDNKILVIISGAVSILSVRFIPDNFVEVLLLQYSTFGIAVATLLPLFIFFLAIYQSNIGGVGRKVAWSMYGAIFLTLWWMRRNDLGNANWVYIIGLLFIIIVLLLDKSLKKQFRNKDLRKHSRYLDRGRRNKLKVKLNELKGVENPDQEIKDEIKDIEKALKNAED